MHSPVEHTLTFNANNVQFNLPVPKGYLVTTPEEAEDVVFNISKLIDTPSEPSQPWQQTHHPS